MNKVSTTQKVGEEEEGELDVEEKCVSYICVIYFYAGSEKRCLKIMNHQLSFPKEA